jgi:hypothetical protein
VRPTPFAALLALALLTGCGADGDDAGAAPTPNPSASSSMPETPDIAGLVVLPEDPSHDHVEGDLEYETAPPLGGPHNPQWLACDVYDEPVPDEFAVHSLEHGAVWLAYDPDLPAGDVEQLAALAARDEQYVLVTPYDGLDSRVVAVAWGRSLEASSADDPRLAEFVDAFAGAGQGGEPGVPCRDGGVTPREAEGLLADQN